MKKTPGNGPFLPISPEPFLSGGLDGLDVDCNCIVSTNPAYLRGKGVPSVLAFEIMITRLEERALEFFIKLWCKLHLVPLDFNYNRAKLPIISVTKSRQSQSWFYFHWFLTLVYLSFALYRIPVSVKQGHLVLHVIFGAKHLAQSLFALNGILHGEALAQLCTQLLQFNRINGPRNTINKELNSSCWNPCLYFRTKGLWARVHEALFPRDLHLRDPWPYWTVGHYDPDLISLQAEECLLYFFSGSGRVWRDGDSFREYAIRRVQCRQVCALLRLHHNDDAWICFHL